MSDPKETPDPTPDSPDESPTYHSSGFYPMYSQKSAPEAEESGYTPSAPQDPAYQPPAQTQPQAGPQGSTPSAYAPMSDTQPPAYTPPAYTPPAYTPPPGAAYGYSQPPAYAPPPGAQYGSPQAPYYQRPPTDGLAVAALVTGILGLFIVPFILGIASLNKIKKTGAGGRGMAIAGVVLGAFQTGGLLLLILFVIAVESNSGFDSTAPHNETAIVRELEANPSLKADYDACSDGDMAACDALYISADMGSALEAFAEDCGGAGRPGDSCEQ